MYKTKLMILEELDDDGFKEVNNKCNVNPNKDY